MAIIHLKGDLLKSDCNILMHQANCLSTMGAGIAKTIKQKYPEVYEVDKKFPFTPKDRLGKYSYAVTKDHKRIIVNLYGQYDWRTKPGDVKTDYKALQLAIEDFFERIRSAKTIIDASFSLKPGHIYENMEPENLKIGLPYKMASDRAGGNWEIVLKILEDASEKFGKDIFIYEL